MLSMSWRMVRLLTDKYENDTLEDRKNDMAEVADLAETAPLIVCDSLVKIYKTKEVEVLALQGLDLTVNRGELMAIIGKSGSGKSTLMNIVGGLEVPSAGRIVVDGQNLAEFTERQMVQYRKKQIGFVWQKSGRNLFPYLTSLENIEAPMLAIHKSAKKRREKAEELLALVGMEHKRDSYPAQMSGGEQQRVAIAVALANEPEILLADEPTGAVDTKTSSNIQDLFRKLNRELGLTIIIVTHDMKLAHKVDRVVMISDGKISTEKILKQHYRDMLDQLESPDMTDETHEEYSVLDKAHRVQLSDDMLAAAGIDTNKVKVRIEDGRVVIEAEEKKETIEPLEVITLEGMKIRWLKKKWIHLLSEEVTSIELRRMNGVFLLQRLRWWLLSM